MWAAVYALFSWSHQQWLNQAFLRAATNDYQIGVRIAYDEC
jgi:hypothetical protein